MNIKNFFRDAVGWGIGLWLFGYILGIIFFMFIPKNLIGWAITPMGVVATLWVLLKKIKKTSLQYCFILGVIWTLIAIVFDHLFIVKMLKLVNYYKPDVYLYYVLTLILPVIVGLRKTLKNDS
jgi:hypothetical protein